MGVVWVMVATPAASQPWSTPEALSDLLRLIPYKRIGEAAQQQGVVGDHQLRTHPFGLVHDLVTAAGGSISAEHGIGQMKRDELARLAPQRVAALKAIKHALDPDDIFNPGKITDAPPMTSSARCRKCEWQALMSLQVLMTAMIGLPR